MKITTPRIVNVVAFGGGTGLSQLLSGLKDNPWLNITAIVSMFDNGGSSGILQDEFGILPPGDILKCIVALSPHELIARQILLTRISHETKPGHNAGNAVLLAFEKMYGSGYIDAVNALSQLLGIKGVVLPVSTTLASLVGVLENGEKVVGEVNVDKAVIGGARIRNLTLEPLVSAFEKSMEAIEAADVILVGPGSFYTSILPNFLPLGVKEAVAKSKAQIIFVANLVREGEGMSHFSVDTYLKLLHEYVGRQPAVCVVNNVEPPVHVVNEYLQEGKTWLFCNSSSYATEIVSAPLWKDLKIARHDRDRLAFLLMSLITRLTN